MRLKSNRLPAISFRKNPSQSATTNAAQVVGHGLFTRLLTGKTELECKFNNPLAVRAQVKKIVVLRPSFHLS
jgi:predicted N-acetyltransferase YhbS